MVTGKPGPAGALGRMTHEGIVLLINATVLLICYWVVLPRRAGADMSRIALHDFMATVVALFLSASLYASQGLTFALGPLQLSWFWYALLTYFAMELPLMLWYLRRADRPPE